MSKKVTGIWNGGERIINGVGRVTNGEIQLPKELADEFSKQGLFIKAKSTPKVKEKEDVRTDD